MARVLLGVTGGISAYKAVELVRLATKAGHAVRVVQTPASLQFVGRATFEAVTGAPVLVDEFEPDPARGAFPGDEPPCHAPIPHLELVRRAATRRPTPLSSFAEPTPPRSCRPPRTRSRSWPTGWRTTFSRAPRSPAR